MNPLKYLIPSRSGPTIHERLLTELIEQNRLLRIDLASRGVAPSRVSPPLQVTPRPPRKPLTERDVIVVTRADLLRQQQEDEVSAARTLPDVADPPVPSSLNSSPSPDPPT